MLKAIAQIGGLQLLTMLVHLARTKSLAVILGPEWIGVMAVVDRLLGIVVQTASLSLPYAAVRFLPELWTRAPDEFADVVGRMRNLCIVLVLGATGFGLAVSLVYPQTWGQELLPYRSVVLIAFLCLPVLMVAPLLQHVIAAQLRHNRSMIFGLGHVCVFTGAAVAGAVIGGLEGLYALYAALGAGFVVLVGRSVLRPSGRKEGQRKGLRLNLPPRIWRFSLTLSALTFVLPFALFYVHYLVLDQFGAETAGWMAAAVGLSFVIRNLLGQANRVFMTPNINKAASPEERVRWTNEYQNTFCLVIIATVLPLVLFPHLAIRILYSPAFLPAAPYVPLFVLLEVLILLTGIYQGLVVALDHLRVHVVQNLAAQTVMIGIATVTIAPYGMLGAGVAGIAAQVFLYAGGTLFLYKRYGFRIPLRTALLTVYVVVAVAGAGAFGATHDALSPAVLGGKVAVYLASLLSLWLLMSPAEKEALWRFLRSIRSRMPLAGGPR